MAEYIHGKISADEFFALKRRENPVRYAQLLKRYPERQTVGPSARTMQQRRGLSGGVAPSMKRTFTDAEWAQIKEAKRIGLKEWFEDYRHALRLISTD